MFIAQSSSERVLKIGEHNFGKVTGKNGDCVKRPIRIALLSSKMLASADKLNNLCITDRNCY